MNEEQDAARLARWLEDPSTDPPPELDPEVVGAIYTLSPKHRPAPRLSVEEILAGITEGPFAAPASVPQPAENPEPKSEGRRDRIRSSASSGEAKALGPAPVRSAPRNRRWVLPVVGTAMAGMLVLLVVVPGMFLYSDSEPKIDAGTPMPEMAAATPRPMAAEPAMPASESPAVSPGFATGSSVAPAERPAQLALPPPAPSGGAAGPGAWPTLGMGEGADEDVVAQGDTRQPSVAPADGGQAPAPVANTATPDANSATVADNYLPTEERADDEMANEAVIAEATSTRRESGREKKPSADAPSRAAASYAPAPASAPAAAKSAEMEMEEPPIWPQDYRERWYVGDSEVEPVYQAARVLEQGGQWSAAAVAYRPLLANGRSTVAQDAAWHCASAWWKAGQGSTALSAIEEGLRRSSANTPYRARLFALKGDILSAQGKSAQAEVAWREARALNASR